MLAYMRCWRRMCIAARSDVTHGVFAEVERCMGFNALELEGWGGLALDHMHRAAPDPMQQARMAEVSQRLTSLPAYARLGAGGQTAVMAGYMDRQGFVTAAANQAANTLLMSMGEALSHMSSHMLLPEVLMGTFFAPSDAHIWYMQCLSVLAGPRHRPVTHLLKLWDSEGDIRLYMLRAFQLHAPEVGSGITSLMTIERVPESRHIDSAPGTRKRLIPKFRADGSGAEPEGKGAEEVLEHHSPQQLKGSPPPRQHPAEQDSRNFSPPGFASVPLPPVPPDELRQILEGPATMPVRTSIGPAAALKRLAASTTASAAAGSSTHVQPLVVGPYDVRRTMSIGRRAVPGRAEEMQAAEILAGLASSRN